jgi:hypothetical protein
MEFDEWFNKEQEKYYNHYQLHKNKADANASELAYSNFVSEKEDLRIAWLTCKQACIAKLEEMKLSFNKTNADKVVVGILDEAIAKLKEE